MAKMVKKKTPPKKKPKRKTGTKDVVVSYPQPNANVPNAADLFFAWGTADDTIDDVTAQVTVDGGAPVDGTQLDVPSDEDWAFEFDDIGSGDNGTLTVQGIGENGVTTITRFFTLGSPPPPV